jgi:hypothetical protein
LVQSRSQWRHVSSLTKVQLPCILLGGFPQLMTSHTTVPIISKHSVGLRLIYAISKMFTRRILYLQQMVTQPLSYSLRFGGPPVTVLRHHDSPHLWKYVTCQANEILFSGFGQKQAMLRLITWQTSQCLWTVSVDKELSSSKTLCQMTSPSDYLQQCQRVNKVRMDDINTFLINLLMPSFVQLLSYPHFLALHKIHIPQH